MEMYKKQSLMFCHRTKQLPIWLQTITKTYVFSTKTKTNDHLTFTMTTYYKTKSMVNSFLKQTLEKGYTKATLAILKPTFAMQICSTTNVGSFIKRITSYKKSS